MLTRRLIVCLDVQGGRVVKGVQFLSLRDIGDPVEMAAQYEKDGADEIVFLDISASAEDRTTLLEIAQKTAERLFIPLTLGGGIREVDDIARALRAGADKVSINSSGVAKPEIFTHAAKQFGSQCVVASIDAKAEKDAGWKVYTHGGRTRTQLDVIEWAKECVSRGAGEILLTSIDRDGARTGYDLALTRAVAQAVSVPVIASGGAGNDRHVVQAFTEGQADAALVAGILHDGKTTVPSLKQTLHQAGVRVRMTG